MARVVARVFKELGYIEQWGSNIQRIKKSCTDHGLAEPRIREKGDFVDVEFYGQWRIVSDYRRIVSDQYRIVGRLRTKADDYQRIVDEYARLRPITPDTASDIIEKVLDTGVTESRITLRECRILA